MAKKIITPNICLNCGTTWTPKYQSARYCSKPCAKEGRTKIVMATEPATKIITCGVCEKQFPWWKKTRPAEPKYCSHACSNSAPRGNGRGRPTKLGFSKLFVKPSRIDREQRCFKRGESFEVLKCKHYHRWLTHKTHFNCGCEEGFEL